jgi:hypothetical protein
MIAFIWTVLGAITLEIIVTFVCLSIGVIPKKSGGRIFADILIGFAFLVWGIYVLTVAA